MWQSQGSFIPQCSCFEIATPFGLAMTELAVRFLHRHCLHITPQPLRGSSPSQGSHGCAPRKPPLEGRWHGEAMTER